MRSPDVQVSLRRFTLLLFAAGVVGTGAELLFLGHTEDYWQFVPLALLATSILALILLVVRPRPASLRLFRYLMVLFVGSGFAGLYLHYRMNAEFELEMYPSLEGLDLLWESLTGATPALAPAAMTYLGLLGMVYTFRHPLMTSPSSELKRGETSQ